MLSIEDLNAAMERNFDICEDNSLHYMSGYFFRKLMDMHSDKKCEICDKNGQLLCHSNANISTEDKSELFLHLKKYLDTSQLYTCSHEFIFYIKTVIQITLHTIENYFHIKNIRQTIVNTLVKQPQYQPKICPRLIEKLTSLIAKVILSKHTQWINAKYKVKKYKSDSLSRKLCILQHK